MSVRPSVRECLFCFEYINVSISRLQWCQFTYSFEQKAGWHAINCYTEFDLTVRKYTFIIGHTLYCNTNVFKFRNISIRERDEWRYIILPKWRNVLFISAVKEQSTTSVNYNDVKFELSVRPDTISASITVTFAWIRSFFIVKPLAVRQGNGENKQP